MESDRWNPDLLKAGRNRRGWSQAKVAEELAVDITTVRRWEQGKVVPYLSHREKMSALFAEMPEKLDLPSDKEKQASNGIPSETAAEAVCSTKTLPGRDELKQRLSPRSLWNVGLGCMKRMSTFRPLNHSSWRPPLIISTILLAVLIIVVIPPAFHWQLPHRQLPAGNSHAQEHYGPPRYSLAMVWARYADTPRTTRIATSTTDRLYKTFQAVYPQLVNRFALDPTAVVTNVTLTTAPNPSPLVSVSGWTVILNDDWMTEHPNAVGLFTHGLTLLVVQHPSGTPGWFSDGMADYARYVYGSTDDDWSLPDGVQPHQSYRQGGAIAARFLLWLEQHTRLDIVDQLNHALQRKQSFSTVFSRLTRHTVDELWKQYKARPDITLTPQQLYKTVTSRKPVYQSSFHLRSNPYKRASTHAQGLSPGNFAMQADITIVSGDGEGRAGFFFRSEQLNDYYGISLSPHGIYDLWQSVQKSDSTHTSRLVYAPSPAIRPGFNQTTNRLTIVAQKQTISLYINGQFITQVVDSTLSYGTLGPMVYSGNKPIDVRFDNFQVF